MIELFLFEPGYNRSFLSESIRISILTENEFI